MAAIHDSADLLNCSFSVVGTSATLPIYKSWTDAAYRNDRHVVAAFSHDNRDPDLTEWPASFPQVISVTAGAIASDQLVFRRGTDAPFEAAGVRVETIRADSGYTELTGSSFAAAHVSGLLARLLSRFPSLDPASAYGLLRYIGEHESGELMTKK